MKVLSYGSAIALALTTTALTPALAHEGHQHGTVAADLLHGLYYAAPAVIGLAVAIGVILKKQ